MLPPDLDWRVWVSRFDRMQERYILRRNERFGVIVRAIQAVVPEPARILDLGCGTGSLTEALLTAFPTTHVTGVDIDPTLLPLACQRLEAWGGRVELVRADLRTPHWIGRIPRKVDAVVSATALHWLSAAELETLYERLPRVLRTGGIFLSADHAAVPHRAIQAGREARTRAMRAEEGPPGAETWEGFWEHYGRALGVDIAALREETGEVNGVEEGLPLAWHFDRLRAVGFDAVDCFWRLDGDAVYGGVFGVAE